MKTTIRKAQINDSKTIAELSRQLGYETEIEAIQSRLAKILENPENCVFVATHDKKVVGWIHCFYTLRVESDFFVEIGGLVVNQDFRKLGIGKQLVDQIKDWATSKQCNKVRVRCNVKRKESHQFYKHLGFKLNKEQKVFDIPLR